MAKKVRVGIIGLGWPGREHLKGYKQGRDAEVPDGRDPLGRLRLGGNEPAVAGHHDGMARTASDNGLRNNAARDEGRSRRSESDSDESSESDDSESRSRRRRRRR